MANFKKRKRTAWNLGKTITICVPAALAPTLMAIAQQLDENLITLLQAFQVIDKIDSNKTGTDNDRDLKAKLYELLERLENDEE